MPLDDLVRGRVALSIRRHEPVGVVSAITPYNGAVIMAFQKLIPALMAGQLGDPAPEPADPAVVARVRRRGRGRRTAGRRPQRRDRGRSRGRRAAHLGSRRRHGVVHGLDCRREPDPRPGCADGEAGVTRARRKVGPDLPRRRRRPRRRRCHGRRRHDRRTGLRRRDPHAGPERPQGRGRRGGLRDVWQRHRRRPHAIRRC